MAPWRPVPLGVAVIVVCLALGMPGLPAAEVKEPPRISLAGDGKALLPVLTSPHASPRVRQAAQTLVRYLDRISGGKFALTSGDGASGIAVGLAADFPALSLRDTWDPKDKTRREDYLLRSHKHGLWVIGASALGVEHAVWDVLYRLGHRQFFPGETWEVVPRSKDLTLAVDVHEHPSFYARNIWYGYGPWDYSAKPYAEWCASNRATSGIVLRTGHAYGGILHAHKDEFAAHPEYLAEVGGQRRLRGDDTKFCIANPDLRKLVVQHSLAAFAKEPTADSISMEPSDGLGWCECARCRALGSPSDRALLLANEVAAAVNKRYGEHYVGMYAYSAHSPPPKIKADPHVVVSVATAFLRDGWTADELIDRWHKQGAVIGIREYYAVHPWDRDLPGQPKGGNLAYLARTIPHFYQKGARFLSAESGDNWGACGLGYYLAARLLWDVRQAEQIETLIADFLDKAFGPAREPMAAFYKLIDGSHSPLMSDDLIGRMYHYLAEARSKTGDPAIHARLDALVLYTHYLELFRTYSHTEPRERQQAFEQLLRHAYRMRKTMMIHTLALYRDLPHRDRSVKVPADAAWNIPEGKNPWKSSKPFSREELDEIQKTGIARHPLIDFQPIAFSTKLQPAEELALPDVPRGSFGSYQRGTKTFYTWIARSQAEHGNDRAVNLSVKGGIVYQTSGKAKLALSAAADAKAADRATVPPDKRDHELKLKTSHTGLHRLDIADQRGGTVLTLAEEMPWTIRADYETTDTLQGRWNLYFYVPKGTKVVGGYAGGVGAMLDGNGRKVFTFAASPNYFSVPVKPGQDGKLWKFANSSGPRVLLTVPPFLARRGRELLLPEEVVRSDKAARAAEPNTLSEEEKKAGWRLLFDGRTTAGWRGYKSKTMPSTWKVENGSLLSRPRQGESRGDIVTVDLFDDFELRLEWKMTKGGNSGVIYRATEEHDQVWESGPEFQILDNAGHMDGLNPLASAGACYAVFPPAKDATRPLGQWNQTRIVAQGKHVEHWLGGEKLLEYNIDSTRWRAHVKTSKFFLTAYGRGNWGRAPKGHLALQDYGGAIEFRNIKIRPLKPPAK